MSGGTGGAEDCVFCGILAGELPASMVYRDERCAAFMDIQPVNAGHVLVVPIAHAENLVELDPEDGAEIFRVGQRMAAALQASGVRCEGVNFFLADGVAAGQEVFHVHLHVLPRSDGDGFGLTFGEHYALLPERAELDDVAAAIRTALA